MGERKYALACFVYLFDLTLYVPINSYDNYETLPTKYGILLNNRMTFKICYKVVISTK